MAIFEEKKIESPVKALVFILFIFLMCYLLGLLAGKLDLFQDEGKYAVAAQEMNSFSPVVTLHGLPQTTMYPLFPALAKGLFLCGLSMEFSLRVISVISLFVLVLLVWFASITTEESSRNSELFSRGQAAAVAAAVMLSTVLTAEKTVAGYPHLLTALILYSGWLIWFDLSVRLGRVKSNEDLTPGRWSLAWIFVGIFGCLAFCNAGIFGLLCFVVPLILQQRPLGIRSKLKHRGFWVCIGLILICMIVLCGAYLKETAEVLPGTLFDSDLFVEHLKDYLKHLVLFPVELIQRFFPWSLILWAPFCSLLIEQLDPNPLFGKFHRTLFVVLAVLIWLNPYAKSRDLLYLVPVLAVLTGQFYWVVVRRYGNRISSILFFAACLLLLISLLSFAFLLENDMLREWYDKAFGIFSRTGIQKPFEWTSSTFSCYAGSSFWFSVAEVILAFVFSAAALICPAKKHAVWKSYLLLFCAAMLLFWGIVPPWRNYCHQDKKEMGKSLRRYLPGGKNRIVYKASSISGLYLECWYMQVRVKTADIEKKIPDNSEKVYVLSTGVPASVGREWNKLCVTTYKDKELSLYEGTIRKDSKK